jgi:4-amino-4-deoxy-L-arabinose transferase-like glycosyltransferase
MSAAADPKLGIRGTWRWLVLAAVCLYVVLSIASSLTKRPWSDEGWFANAPWNLVTKGWMGTTVVEQASQPFLNGVDRYTYWVMPFHLILQAAMYKIFGFSLLTMRSLSLIFGLMALGSWFLIMKALSQSNTVAALTVVLLALDYNFVMSSSFGRVDMMCAGLGSAGLAAYLALRERNLTYAILLGNCFVVASGMTHHLGILALFGLIFLVLFFDRKQLKWRHLLVALIPYLIAATAWSFYILQSPQLFLTQFRGNATADNRLGALTAPLAGLHREITERYLIGFGLGPHSQGNTGPIRLKALILLAYVVAIVGALLIKDIRSKKSYQALLILAALYFALLTIWDNQKLTWYLIHVIPVYTAILAVFVVWCWRQRFVPRWLLGACMFAFMSLQLGGVLQRIRLDPYHKSFAPAIDFLKKNVQGDQVIMASAELGFGMGNFDHLIDDSRLGFYSGKKPDFIVIEEVYRSEIDSFKNRRPELYQFIQSRLTNDYTKVYDQNLYEIYARR